MGVILGVFGGRWVTGKGLLVILAERRLAVTNGRERKSISLCVLCRRGITTFNPRRRSTWLELASAA